MGSETRNGAVTMFPVYMEKAFAALPDSLPIEEIHQRLDVVQEALTFIGTPYHHQGRIRGVGVDCGMLPMEVYHACGLVPALETPVYPQDFHMHRGEEFYLQLVEAHAVKVDRAPLPGDLVLFRFGRVLSHGAIVVAWPCIIHAYLQARAVVLDDAEANTDLSRRFEGVWTFWGGK